MVDLDSREREERLRAAEPSVRERVLSLLRADERADEDLERFETGVAEIVRGNTPENADRADPLNLAGTTFSHFRVIEYLASGGMGAIYSAQDTRLNRAVALKFPLPYNAPDGKMKARFLREAQAAGALDHINLCPVHEAGESEKGLFIAMPLYQGTTLRQRLWDGGAMPVKAALAIARQIAAGLSYAHTAGIVHRDLKPGNVMLLPDGLVKILDFGLAKATDVSQTKSGVTLGTVSYMAPEQVRGQTVDARADLWALGVILYEMLTGKRPFAGEHDVSIANAILHDEPEKPSALRGDLPRLLGDVVLSLLEKDPRHRYQSASNLSLDLEAIERGVSPSFRPPARSAATKWVVRHRAAVLSGAVIVAATIALAAPRVSAVLNKPTDNPDAYRFYIIGRDYEQRESMAAAESLYHRALALDSGFALARARLAVVYAQCWSGGSRDCYRRNIDDTRANRLELIKSEAQKALRLKPGLAEGHFALGLYWEQRELPDSALAEYSRARRKMARAGELHAATGRAYRTKGMWKEAITRFERAIAMDPRDANSMADLATTYSRLREYEKSVELWNRYLAVAPDAYQGMAIKGNVYLRWHGTVDSLEAIFARLPSDLQKRSYTTRVLIARIRNRPLDALRAIDEAPARGPDDPAAINSRPLQRAHVYLDMGDSTRARIHYDSALRQLAVMATRRKGDFRIHTALGLAYAGLGREAAAVRSADRAMRLMPVSRSVPLGTTALRGAAEVFAQLPSQHGRAIEILDQLLQMPAGREASVPLLRIEPAWRPLRSEPRFQQLLSRYSAR